MPKEDVTAAARTIDAAPNDPIHVDTALWACAGNVVVGLPQIDERGVTVRVDSIDGALMVDEVLRDSESFVPDGRPVTPVSGDLYEVSGSWAKVGGRS